jgi:quinol monooxygenase YgiN
MVPFQAAEGKTEQLRRVLKGMLPPCNAEPGCEFYNLFESQTPGHFFFHELWTTQVALDAHNLTPHLARFKEEIKHLVAQPPIAHKVRQVE